MYLGGRVSIWIRFHYYLNPYFHAYWTIHLRVKDNYKSILKQNIIKMMEMIVIPSEKILRKRRERRYNERKTKKLEKSILYNNPNILLDKNNLIEGFYKTKRNVSWKGSIQQFELNLFRNILDIIESLLSLDDSKLNFYSFSLMERGKIRDIDAVNVRERTIQHVLVDDIIVPYVKDSLIYDNGASLKGKGTDFSLNRLKVHLGRFYRYNNNSNDGVILLIDFHDYFKSIDHLYLKDMIDVLFTEPIIKTAIYRIIDSFNKQGLGLGSQLCQILAVIYINKIDHYIKEVLRVHGYERYMDDSYLIFKTYEEAEQALEILRTMYKNININMNEKKTKIVSLKDNSFIYLKKIFILTDTGKVIVKGNKKNINNMKHKIKKFKKFYENDIIDLKYIISVLKSWNGTNKKYYSKICLDNMDKYVTDLIYELNGIIHK